jgi:hypothetical protein
MISIYKPGFEKKGEELEKDLYAITSEEIHTDEGKAKLKEIMLNMLNMMDEESRKIVVDGLLEL